MAGCEWRACAWAGADATQFSRHAVRSVRPVTLEGGMDHANASGDYRVYKKIVGAAGAETGGLWDVGHDVLGGDAFFDCNALKACRLRSRSPGSWRRRASGRHGRRCRRSCRRR
jgi:hypothetical protein